MGLLHSNTQQGQRSAAWEQVSQAAQATGIPLPPPITLPALPDLSGGCNATQLEAALGQAAAGALRAMLAAPALQAQIAGAVGGQAAQLDDYLAVLGRERQTILDQLADLTGTEGALGQAQELLGGLRGALGQATSIPIAGELLTSVSAACPAVGALLTFAESGISSAESALSGVQATAAALASKLAQLTDVESHAQELRTQLQQRIDSLPDLFLDAIGGEG
ncbi:hypothetical protein [Deinococcus arenicola]|uniref:Uncharacterized protein n=1 Tax=Deinococcus arenicola TaxID=2994950 RepID=A0ABU4DVF4_9DEIO|nr:hypothetical protein [Deinococcus sp. ZS9-10]MDV6376363.1 hypothetical protein [Deinococcus sp. ZS9-10]